MYDVETFTGERTSALLRKMCLGVSIFLCQLIIIKKVFFFFVVDGIIILVSLIYYSILKQGTFLGCALFMVKGKCVLEAVWG